MDEISKLTGRGYKLFEYYGVHDASDLIVAMGSVSDTIKETIDYLASQGKKSGLINVHLYRPFSLPHFTGAIPDTVKRIAVLDRTKEPGSLGEPLYQDVLNALHNAKKNITLIGGRFGLSCKDTMPCSNNIGI